MTLEHYGGATLEFLRIKNQRKQTSADLIIFVAGICNFTHVTYQRSKRIVSYTDDINERQRKVANIKETILDLLGTNRNCLVSTIVPAKICEDSADADAKQTALLQDIEEVNLFIKNECETRDIRKINLAKTCYKTTKKRRGKKTKTYQLFNKSELIDGVHATDRMKDVWAQILAKAISRALIERESSSEGD